jgi:cardiolipin synthase C
MICRPLHSIAVLLAVAILALPAQAADKVCILHSDGDAVQARVDLVQQAKQEINLSYYIVGDDQVPLTLLSLLREAARRGVAVRLLVDGHDGDNQMPRALQAHLLREGIEIREYHPPLVLNGYWIKNRMHDKLLIVDGEHLITGGRNLKDEYFGLDCVNFVDRDVYLRGCAAAEARCYFMARWESCNVRDTRLCGRVNQKKTEKEMKHVELDDGCDEEAICAAGCLLDQARARAQELQLTPPSPPAPLPKGEGSLELNALPKGERSLKFNTGTDWSAGAREVECVRFLHDDPCGKKTKSPGIADDMLELLAGARCSIVLETPYFVLSKQMKRILASAACRGVQVTVLTNSLGTNNHHTAQAAYENDKRWFLRHGIELWELTGCNHLHAKAAVIDGCVAVIGSYNFDNLSEKRNSEVAVAIYDQQIAAGLLASIDVHRQTAYRIGRNARPEGYSSKYPGVGRKLIKELRRKRLAAPAMRGSL